jgi:ArgJ family protein
LLLDLPHRLVRDGEGASKFVQVAVTGAVCEASVRQLARTVCESPLINTAIAGGENNWGRIAAAIARAGEPIRHDLLSIRFGQIWAVGRRRRRGLRRGRALGLYEATGDRDRDRDRYRRGARRRHHLDRRLDRAIYQHQCVVPLVNAAQA